jgi:hypothetical protein
MFVRCAACVEEGGDRSSGRTLAHGGQEHASRQGHQLTNTLMLTHAHAHAVQETSGSMLPSQAFSLAE